MNVPSAIIGVWIGLSILAGVGLLYDLAQPPVQQSDVTPTKYYCIEGVKYWYIGRHMAPAYYSNGDLQLCEKEIK